MGERVQLNWLTYPLLYMKWSESHSVVSDSLRPHELYSQWNSSGQNTGVGSLSLLQGIFPTQISNPGLPHCGLILYQLSHQGTSRILEWVAYPFSRIFPTQESNQDLLHCRQILYQPSYQGMINGKFNPGWTFLCIPSFQLLPVWSVGHVLLSRGMMI